MYAVTVVRPLVAQHALTVPDPGPEGDPHSHRYRVEVELTGEALNEYDYLVDIDAVEAALDGVESRYADAFLNDLPEFEGYNPSVERFARVIHDRLADELAADAVAETTVTVWEDDVANAAYTAPL
ncbi:6-pyruvoyltetrahydropterin/6-carboxytetrahydropterin synthase [Halogeometricum rufum]|mgnify:CR=1 FL=1|jgi:6-pyruvoyltetrahydropterin/6-carboxytetrahydropterin synthase|uniref:6-pyruvoyltetrahydropterin/6-carboxytetrahydropterin synthase n=1 Tax=Halogeometricum rufum TaxID=553469 RepID=A0A1I6FY20_9EURY|nr:MULTISPECIES: 6-carboxytetrahydropterin synthase [Halogeometricum]MUV59077.1 6-carboxytetrahydropterin synthase [Halogeometricum sp. CBA1124]SFR34804.1 6-pyruvoyltetrahydropterin/6-carboxytetrahydropterin synthase [Halogeometricum rufum]